MFRRLLFLAVLIIFLLLAGGAALWWIPHTDRFWRWGGEQLVEFARDRVNGEVSVQQISGSPLTGITFKGIRVVGPKGEVLRAESLELRLSLWSFVKLQPVIGKLALSGLNFNLEQYPDGSSNVTGILRKRPPPPFKVLNFRDISIAGGAFSLTQDGVTRRYSDLDLSLALTVRNPRRPDQVILVHQASLAVTTPLGRFGLYSRLTYDQSCLRLLSVTVESGERTWLTLAGEIKDCSVQPNFVLDGILGPVQGQELKRLWPHWPGAWDLTGNFRLSGNLARLHLAGEGKIGGVAYTLTSDRGGPLGAGTTELDLQVKGLEQGLLAALEEKGLGRTPLPGPLNARLHLKGTAGPPWEPGEIKARLNIDPFQYREARIEELNLNLEGGLRKPLFNGVARGNFGKVTAAGQVILPEAADSSPSGEVKLSLESFQPTQLGWSGLPPTRLDGQIKGHFKLPRIFALSGATGSGDLELKGTVGAQAVQELKASLTWDGQKLAIPQGRLRLDPLTAEVKGFLSGSQVDLNFTAATTSPGRWPFFPLPISGRLKGEGSLKGQLNQPQFAFSGHCQHLSWPGGELASGTLALTGAGMPPQTGRVELKGKGLATPAGTFSQAAFAAQGEEGKWRFNFTAAAPKEAQAEIRGRADVKARPLAIQVESCLFSSPRARLSSTAPFTIRLIPGWEISPAAFRVNGGALTVQGRAQGSELTGHLEAKSFPAEYFPYQGAPLKGNINGQVRLTGTPQNPVMEGRLNWGPGGLGDFAFKSLNTTWSYQDSRLRLNGRLEEKTEGPTLSWEGYLPCQVSLWPLKFAWADQDLHLRFQGEKANLGMLTALTREIQAASGEVSVRAEVRGRPQQPRLSGFFRWSEGSMRFRLAGAPYHLLPGEAKLEGNRLVFPQIIFQNGGTAQISGAITFAGFQPQKVEARAHLENFIALRRSGSQATGNGSVTLKGPWLASNLEGRLLVSKTSFRPTFFRAQGLHEDIVLVPQASPQSAEAPPPPAGLEVWRNMQARIVLEAPRQVTVEDPSLKVELGGTLVAVKKRGEPICLDGVMKPISGTYKLQGLPFKIEQGTIRFPGNPKEPVTLEGRATHKIEELTLVLAATGPIAQPRVRLESIPPLPPGDLLSYLVFGQPSRSLTREQYLTMNQQAMGLVGGLSAQKVKELLGEDFPLVSGLRLKTTQDPDKKAVGVAQQLTKDISVSYERKMNRWGPDPPTQVRLEYKLNKYFSVETQMGRRNNGGDVFFNLDF